MLRDEPVTSVEILHKCHSSEQHTYRLISTTSIPFGCLLTSNKRWPQDGARPRVTLLVDDQSAENHRSQMRNIQELWLQRTSCESSGCYSVPPYHFRSDRLSSWWLHFPCFGLKSSAAGLGAESLLLSSSSLFRPNENQTKCQVAFVLRVNTLDLVVCLWHSTPWLTAVGGAPCESRPLTCFFRLR
jgi:hypothetical protein